MEIKKNKLGVAASAVVIGLTASVLGSGACLQTISTPSAPPRPTDRLTCSVRCSGTYVGQIPTVASGGGREFRLAFENELTTFTSCGTGVTMAQASAFCANTMQSSSCTRLGLVNAVGARAARLAGQTYLMNGMIENLSCTTESAILEPGRCTGGSPVFCNHSGSGAAGKPGDTPEEQTSWAMATPAYTPSDLPSQEHGQVMPQVIKLAINGVEAAPRIEGRFQVTSACTNCSSHLVGLSLKAPPFFWGVVQVSDLNIYSWDAIPISVDGNGNFTVDASQHPIAVSLQSPIGFSSGMVPVNQIVGHIDSGARTITLDLRGAQVLGQQATVTMDGVIHASY